MKKSICPECGTEFTQNGGRGKPRVFCTEAHKTAHAARCASRGKTLVKLVQAQYALRSAKKGTTDYELFAFFRNEVATLAAEWNEQDRNAGRMDPAEYAKIVCDIHPVNPAYNNGRTFEASRWMDRMTENRG